VNHGLAIPSGIPHSPISLRLGVPAGFLVIYVNEIDDDRGSGSYD